MIFNEDWHRFMHSIVVFARSATHTAEFAKKYPKKTAKNLPRTGKNMPRTTQINDGTDTPSNIHSPQLAKEITAR